MDKTNFYLSGILFILGIMVIIKKLNNSVFIKAFGRRIKKIILYNFGLKETSKDDRGD